MEVHAEGFRAHRGRPHALFLLPGRNAGLLGRLSRAYAAEIIDVRGPTTSSACAATGASASRPASWTRSSGRRRRRHGAAAARRRSRIAAARVVAALVVTLALAALAYAALPDPPGPHYVYGRTGRHLVENGRPVNP